MSELSDWIGQLTGQPVTTAPVPMEKPNPAVPTPTEQPPPLTDSSSAAVPTAGVPAPLEFFLRQQNSGHGDLSDEMYNYYGGDALLQAMQRFDPNARWDETQLPGEAGGRGRRLAYDVRTLPSVTLPNGEVVAGNDAMMRLKPYDRDLAINPNMFLDDANYGRLTDARNVKQQEGKWWEYVAPLLIGAVAPMAAGALAGAGIGGAGLTGAVTGSGVAAGAGGTPWWAQSLSKLPQTVRGATQGGGFNPAALGTAALGAGANYFGLPSEFASAAGGAYNAFKPKSGGAQGYDPTAVNRGGSSKKAKTNDSSLVANQFAPGAYRNSNLWGYNG